MKNVSKTLILLGNVYLFLAQSLFAQNWQQVGTTPERLRAYDQNGQIRTVVTDNNIYVTTDGGNNWTQRIDAQNRLLSGSYGTFSATDCRIFNDVFILVSNDALNFSFKGRIITSSDRGLTFKTQLSYDEGSTLAGAWKVNATTYVFEIFTNIGATSKFYISTDKAQTWSLFYTAFNIPNIGSSIISYAGSNATQLAFLEGDKIKFININNNTLISTIQLPEAMKKATVNGTDIRLANWTTAINNSTIKAWKSTNNGASFTPYQKTLPISTILEVQLLGEYIFLQPNDFSPISDQLTRFNYNDFNNPVQLNVLPTFKFYFPFKQTTDGNLVNQNGGITCFFTGSPETPDRVNRQIVVSSDNFTSYTAVARPTYSIDAIPLVGTKRLVFIPCVAYNTTDGKNFSFVFSDYSANATIFDGCTINDNDNGSIPRTDICNDGISLKSTISLGFTPLDPFSDGRNKILQAGGALYAQGIRGGVKGIWKSLDKGNTWTLQNANGTFFTDPFGDKVNNNFYSVSTFNPTSGFTCTPVITKSVNFGTTWKQLSINWPSGIKLTSCSNPGDKSVFAYNNHLFFQTDSALYLTSNGGQTIVEQIVPFRMDGAKVWIQGNELFIKNKNEQVWKRNIDLWLPTPGLDVVGGNIDLELSVVVSPPNPPIFSNYNVTYTIVNKGNIPATTVYIFPNQPAGSVQQGGNPTTFSGNYTQQPFGVTLPALNGSYSQEYHYFRNTNTPLNIWAEIEGANEPDLDSSPGNGVTGIVNEDDEALAGSTNPCFPDLTPPVILGCPANLTVQATSTFTNVSWVAPTATDNCGTLTPFSNSPNNSTYPVGVFLILYTATDNAGNTATCNFTLTVATTTNPLPDLVAYELFLTGTPTTLTAGQTTGAVIGAINNGFAAAPASVAGIYLSTNNTFSTNDVLVGTVNTPSLAPTILSANLAGNITIPAGQPSGSYFLIQYADYNNTVVEGNENNNFGFSSFLPITITGSVNTGCTGNQILNNGFESDFNNWVNPNGATIVNDAQTGTKAMSLCPSGAGLVYQFKTATAGTNYTFKAFAKKTGTAPTNIFIKFMNSGFSPIQTDFQQVTNATYTEITLSKLAPTGTAYMEIGFIKDNGTGCLLADDACLTIGGGGNPCAPDVLAPTIAGCPNNISLTTTAASATATWTAPTASDNCGTPTITSNFFSGQSFPIGLTTVTYTALDAANNASTCNFTVNVSNQPTGGGCTGNLLTNNGFESSFASWENPDAATIVTDAQAGTKAVSICNAGSGRVYQFKTATAGTNYTFKAFAKKTGTAPTNIFIKFMNSGFSPIQTDFQQVTSTTYTEITLSKLAPTGTAYLEVGFIKDNGAGCLLADEACLTTGGGTNPCSPDVLVPTIASCPGNINLTTTASSLTATWTAPTATDNCGTPTLTSNFNSGASFPIGSTTVTYTARDAANNTAICSFIVTVSQNGGGNQADLNITNLNVPTTTIAAGSVISYSFTARNTGTLTTGNFSIKTYFSTDNVLSTNDIQDGTINTGNFTPGTANVVNGASTVPATLAAGNYFLIVKIDADNQVVESNENNNNAASVSTFAVTNGSGGTGADLQLTITADKSQVAQWNNVAYTIVAKNNGNTNISSATIKVGGCNASGFQTFSNAFGLVYAGAPGQPSIGNFNSITQDWNISNLAAGQSSTFNLTLFSTGTAERKVVAYASAQSPTDPDSQPSGTLANCTPTQDDEAVWTINVGQSLLAIGDRQEIKPLEDTQITDFQLFPNPAVEILNIDLTQWMGKAGKLIFINQLGKVVFEKTFENITTPIETIDLSGFNNGQYFVKMETAGQRTQVKRLVVSRMY
jgi:hypothetical protein